MLMSLPKAALALPALLLLACANIVTIKGSCVPPPNAGTCFGTMDVPDDQTEQFRMASVELLDALNSTGFSTDLETFSARFSASGGHAKAWIGVSTEDVVQGLKEQSTQTTLTTYGGPWALLKYWFAGNLAYDGDADGPIRLNRWGLPRPSPSLANSMAHELAHRIGLTHPNSGSTFSVALCEPPYVIGSLVEKQIRGTSWSPSENDCELLKK
jgi:hypothetical protein